jgi:hypothetical protein
MTLAAAFCLTQPLSIGHIKFLQAYHNSQSVTSVRFSHWHENCLLSEYYWFNPKMYHECKALQILQWYVPSHVDLCRTSQDDTSSSLDIMNCK